MYVDTNNKTEYFINIVTILRIVRSKFILYHFDIRDIILT